MTPRIHVLVVHDRDGTPDVVVRLEGLDGVVLVPPASGPEEAVRRCLSESPDVVVVDLDVPGDAGVETARRVREACPETKVVLRSSPWDPQVLAGALAAGASGCIAKEGSAEDLLDAIRRAAAGELVMPARDLPLVLDQLQNRGGPEPAHATGIRDLTTRETEILRALAAGRTTTEIAEDLRISPLTVQSHVKSILAKLRVHSKIEAVTLAWRFGVAASPRTA